MAKRTKYGESTTMMSFRVPNSMMDRVRDIVYLSIDKMQYEKANDILDKSVLPVEVFKSIKEPTKTKFIPFTTKIFMIVGYGCLKDEDGTCYYKDSPNTALVFENEEHLKDYLLKYKP